MEKDINRWMDRCSICSDADLVLVCRGEGGDVLKGEAFNSPVDLNSYLNRWS